MRFLTCKLLLTALIVNISGGALADDVITLDLPSINPIQPQSRAESSAEIEAKAFREFSQRRIVQHFPDRHAGYSKKDRSVGRLGVTNKSTDVRAARSASQKRLCTIQAGTYVALNVESGGWVGILMADRSTGWVPKSAINILDYQVVGPAGNYSNTIGAAATGNVGGLQRSILETAYTFLGVPYKYGGESSRSGIDCSALVQRCFSTMGIRLPRTAAEQCGVGIPISPAALQAADRLYFSDRKGRVDHTGIYIGNGYFIHASGAGKRVMVSNLYEAPYNTLFSGARR